MHTWLPLPPRETSQAEAILIRKFGERGWRDHFLPYQRKWIVEAMEEFVDQFRDKGRLTEEELI